MDKKVYAAHISLDGRVQTVEEHLKGTAIAAQDCLQGVELGAAAFFAGRMHDMGKYTDQFDEYIRAAAEGMKVKRGSVVHTFAGTRYILERINFTEKDLFKQLATEMLAYAVGAHHGLFDCIGEQKPDGFTHRIQAHDEVYKEARRVFHESDLLQKEVDTLYEKAVCEINSVLHKLVELVQTSKDQESLNFYFSMLSRLLLSAVIEGDRKDTGAFMANCAVETFDAKNQEFWTKYVLCVEERIAKLSSDTPVQEARHIIATRCKEAGTEHQGIFRLNAPTGAGKTLSSLLFASVHAKNNRCNRIIFTSPLLSILEQNAEVIKDCIGDDQVILEHHSNVVHERDTEETMSQEGLLTENWDAPIIITTLVQLLNTLFEGKTSSVRRFQSLCNSVIVIDEVQTVPTKMLTLFNLSIDFLAFVCKATVVLCSATQPCLEAAHHPIHLPVRDIVPYDKELWSRFQRTTLVDMGAMDLNEITEFSVRTMEQIGSLLIVCNRKDEAETLFHNLEKEDWDCYFLSASLCPNHRRDTVTKLKNSLYALQTGGKKTICVSTQVIEAGVDVSFTCAIRITAGMDNIIQTAGRCNRNGESTEHMPVYIIRWKGENLNNLPDIQRAKNATQSLLERNRRNSEEFSSDLSSDKAIETYYRLLYGNMDGEHQDYKVAKEEYTIFSLLTDNASLRDESFDEAYKYILHQAFQLAGKSFQVFDDNTRTLVVPYGKGAELIKDLNSARAEHDIVFAKSLLNEAKDYSISVYQYQFEQLKRMNAIFSNSCQDVFWLEDAFYSEVTGLTLNPICNDIWEV